MSIEILDFYSNLYGDGKIQKPGTDYMFRKDALPTLSKKDVDYLITDPDLLKLMYAMIKDTPAHRTKLFLADNTACSYGEMSASIMLGEGMIVTVDKNEKAKEIIEDWCDNINMAHETVERMIKNILIDAYINSDSLWRVWINKNPEFNDPIVDVARVSMVGLLEDKHPTKGCVRWIQSAIIPKLPQTKAEFYASDPTQTVEYESVITIVPNEINCALYFKLFETPPTSTILIHLLLKRWGYWYMRKFMEKYWAPFITAYVGDFKNGFYPKSPEAWKDSLQWAANEIRKLRDFSGAAFPAHTKLEVLDTKMAKQANVYIETIEHLSKEIAIGLYASISTRDAEGKSKAGQDIAQEGYLRNMRSIRESISLILRKFFSFVLLPAYNINGIRARDIKITFPELKLDRTKEILEAVEIAAKIGVFKDFKEIRKILNPIWKHIDENITESEDSDMKKLFLEINSPSRAMGDSPQQRASSVKTTAK